MWRAGVGFTTTRQGAVDAAAARDAPAPPTAPAAMTHAIAVAHAVAMAAGAFVARAGGMRATIPNARSGLERGPDRRSVDGQSRMLIARAAMMRMTMSESSDSSAMSSFMRWRSGRTSAGANDTEFVNDT